MTRLTKARGNPKQPTQHNFLDTKAWKSFERLVAAIHRAEMQGAKVKWNDEINERQFDVTVRFARGPYNYLTVIECKDWDSPVPVEKVEALVTKAGDVKADKAVMVSASGFQSGCFAVADRHGVELFTVEEVNAFPEDLLTEGLIPVLSCYNFRLRLVGRSKPIVLPEARNILPFLVRKATIKTGPYMISLEAIVKEQSKKLFAAAKAKGKSYRSSFRPGTVVTLPDIVSGNTLEEITFDLSAIEFQYRLVPARKLRPGVGLDPHLLANLNKTYRFTNTVTKSSTQYQVKKLEVGHGTVMQPGQFYIDTDTDYYFYCEKIEGDRNFLTLLEGYQHGDHFQADIIISGKITPNYIELTDAKEINRLKAMLETLRKRNPRT